VPELTKRGFRVWRDDEILRHGDDLQVISQAIRATGVYLAVISPGFCDRNRWAFKEFRIAQKEESRRFQRTGQKTFILPVLHSLHGGLTDQRLQSCKEVADYLQGRLCRTSDEPIASLVTEMLEKTGTAVDQTTEFGFSGLEIGRFPVTNFEYRRFISDGGYTEAGLRRWWTPQGQDFWRYYVAREKHHFLWKQGENGGIRTEDAYIDGNGTQSDTRFNRFNQPVTGVCYFEAEAYGRWLTSTMADTSRSLFRMPTEEEWMSALTHGGTRTYPWGDSPPEPKQCNLFDGGSEPNGLPAQNIDNSNYRKMNYPNSFGGYPEGATRGDDHGCQDLIGNVWEWVSGFAKPDYLQSLRPSVDEGSIGKIMGNCCFDSTSSVKPHPIAYRRPGYRHVVIGFRIIKEEGD
jgi:formylglycine-generating enzyme required for sulfatase activity